VEERHRVELDRRRTALDPDADLLRIGRLEGATHRAHVVEVDANVDDLGIRAGEGGDGLFAWLERRGRLGREVLADADAVAEHVERAGVRLRDSADYGEGDDGGYRDEAYADSGAEKDAVALVLLLLLLAALLRLLPGDAASVTTGLHAVGRHTAALFAVLHNTSLHELHTLYRPNRRAEQMLRG